MKFSVSKAIDTDLCDSTVVTHNALVWMNFTDDVLAKSGAKYGISPSVSPSIQVKCVFIFAKT